MAGPLYYEIVPGVRIVAIGEYFVPGRSYFVSSDVYNLTLGDGKKFSDLCKSAKPMNNHPG